MLRSNYPSSPVSSCPASLLSYICYVQHPSRPVYSYLLSCIPPVLLPLCLVPDPSCVAYLLLFQIPPALLPSYPVILMSCISVSCPCLTPVLHTYGHCLYTSCLPLSCLPLSCLLLPLTPLSRLPYVLPTTYHSPRPCHASPCPASPCLAFPFLASPCPLPPCPAFLMSYLRHTILLQYLLYMYPTSTLSC